MSNNKVELLSPAGNLEKLKIAFKYGADAVYGGVSHFSLRIRSGKDFSFESFKEGVEYTHKLGKKIYVTINGFPFNSQIELLKKHIKKMALLKPDAFIVATPGVVMLCKEIAPDIDIHLSTQANVMNYLDAKVYWDMGVTRIIAAREISLKDIIEIKKKIPKLEIEIFVHGSMCFAYSGRCLISALQLGRVPNRGSCANDCRFEYEVYVANKEHGSLFRLEEQKDIGTYIFNAKDMNLASHIDTILDSGVIASLKIEGRTKSSYYVAVATRSYKNAINDYYDGKFNPEIYQQQLHTTKNRGFSDAYLIHRPFERDSSQNHDWAMSKGDYEVSGIVCEDKNHFMCKFTIRLNEEHEILLPLNQDVKECDNDIGSIVCKNGKYYISFKQLITKDNKTLNAVHSGNTNPIQLPCMLEYLVMFRKHTKEINKIYSI